MPAALPCLEYPDMEVRVVRAKGVITFLNQTWYLGEAFAALPVGLLDLTAAASPKHIARSVSSLRSPQD